MSTTPESTDYLDRLRHERELADRVYNSALTALDGAIQRLREMPHQPPPYDELQIASLNDRCNLGLKPPGGHGWRKRLQAHLWAIVAPAFERQQTFNSTLVDHINRNVAMHRETTRCIESTLAVLREELERLVNFETRLILYAQQVTPYVDTKDRHVSGLPLAGVHALSDAQEKLRESMVAREQRYEIRVNELRSTLGVMQRTVQMLKRELEHRETPTGTLKGAVAATPSEGSPAAAAPSWASSRRDSYKYVGFEDEFRGAREEIRRRVTAYLPDFEGAGDVLDIGCGRGEFLEMLRDHGISARGVDINPEMAAICQTHGLQAIAGDALTHLTAQPDASLGGIFAAQVVEHLEPDYLIRLLETAYDKLRPGGRIVLETINPTCWYAFFASYIRDVTHVRPLHPDTLYYFLIASGFARVETRFSSPVSDETKLRRMNASPLRPVSEETASADRLSELTTVLNENVDKLNGLLFTYLDYAAVGSRP